MSIQPPITPLAPCALSWEGWDEDGLPRTLFHSTHQPPSVILTEGLDPEASGGFGTGEERPGVYGVAELSETPYATYVYEIALRPDMMVDSDPYMYGSWVLRDAVHPSLIRLVKSSS